MGNIWGFFALVAALLVSFVESAQAEWATGVTTATTSLSSDLTAVGAIILGLVCLIYGFRVVKGMLARG